MSIQDKLKKINPLALWLRLEEKIRLDILAIMVIVLVAIFSYGLGRFSFVITRQEPIYIQQSLQEASDNKTQVAQVSTREDAKKGEVIVSKKGKKYHFPWCSGAKTIAPQNKVVYKSPQEAEKAGYTLASNCK